MGKRDWYDNEEYRRPNWYGEEMYHIDKIVAEAERRGQVKAWEEAIISATGFGLRSDKPCHEAEILESFRQMLSSLNRIDAKINELKGV